ncbi:MAG TPA: 5-oxoprolinase subunit PxpB [Syntrophales bacterium]|nr:5-oxoprolinase subunit PxpB [Syntrophales bacterium]
MKISRYGEEAIRILFGDKIDLEIHDKVRRYYFFLKSLQLEEITDIIPSFRSCLIIFDRRKTSYEALRASLQDKEFLIAHIEIPEPETHDVPVEYGGESGFDIDFVASHTGLSEDKIIEVHTSVTYKVFAVGFLPGFPYLGILDQRLYVPRLETPRLKVPEGSVGLAQLQTGIYPFESPAGWRIIGRTNKKLFDYSEEPYSIFQIGDEVRFIRA